MSTISLVSRIERIKLKLAERSQNVTESTLISSMQEAKHAITQLYYTIALFSYAIIGNTLNYVV